MTEMGVGLMDLGIRKFVYVSLDTGIRQYDGLFNGYPLARI